MEVYEASVRYAGALSRDELAYWVAFSRVIGIGPIRFKQLLDYLHYPQLEQFSTKLVFPAYFP